MNEELENEKMTINLELRWLDSSTKLNDITKVGVYAVGDKAVSNPPTSQDWAERHWSTMHLLINWNTEYLRLTDFSQAGAAPSMMVFWPKVSTVYSKSQKDTSGQLINDGDASLVVFGQLGAKQPAQVATPAGTLVTTLLFRVLREGVSRVELAPPGADWRGRAYSTEVYGQAINYFNLGTVKGAEVGKAPPPPPPPQDTPGSYTAHDIVTEVIRWGVESGTYSPEFSELLRKISMMANSMEDSS